MNVHHGFTVENGADIHDAFAFAAEHGCDFVDLNMDFQFDPTRTDPKRVRSLADDQGLNLAVHLPQHLDAGSDHEYVREGACRELEASVDAALEMGTDRGVMHANSITSPEKWT